MQLLETGAERRRLAGQPDPELLLDGLDPGVVRNLLPGLWILQADNLASVSQSAATESDTKRETIVTM